MTETKLETVAKGDNCRLEGPRNSWAIHTEQAWSAFYVKLESASNSGLQIPHVDFSKHSVLAVFMGQKNNDGYSTEITTVLQNGKDLEVYVQETSPNHGDRNSQTLTKPYHIIKVPKAEGKVEFKYL